MADVAGWRWIPHAEHVWVPGRLKLEDPVTKIQTWTTCNNEDVEYKAGEIDESKLEAVSETSLHRDLDNLVQLDEFGEGAIVHQLRKRYAIDKIYTTIGTILVSVNPYKLLPIYTSSVVDKYRDDYTSMPPHCFQIAADAYKRLLDEGMNQAVIISGESGAGKTEATKTVLQYLSDVAGSTSNVEQQILQSNPCLEAFGNAKTIRNDNSSRFGKWMEVIFAVGGRICAARIINYLLEKSRVVKQAEGERNYHIFYQVCKALPKEVKERLFLKDASDYLYLKQSSCYTINGIDEHTELQRTKKALLNLNFTEEDMDSMWAVLAAILNIGNLVIKADKTKDGTIIENMDQLEKVAKILQLNTATLQTALTFRSVTIRGSVSMIPLKLEEAIENRDALAKALYGKMFDWLIIKCNETLMKVKLTEKEMMTVGILDIFGFEIFENNAFEQFCINYANEKLQQHFNNHIFKLEQDEYKKEKIDVSFIEFIDNIECLKLIEASPLGILKMLDEEVTIPKGGDKSLITKMHKKFAEEDKHPFYGLIRKQPEVFIIKHYAGAVVYDSTGFVNKNRDKLHDSLTDLVQQSEVALIRGIFLIESASDDKNSTSVKTPPAGKAAPAAGGGGGAKERRAKAAAKKGAGTTGKVAKGGSRTLCAQFSSQLRQLMETLTAANPHYIRCVKPNALKKSGDFSSKMVLRQMQYAGLFEAIRIRRAGFPFRVPHGEFVSRYRVCMNASELKTIRDILEPFKDQKTRDEAGKAADAKAAAFVLASFAKELDPKEYQMGLTKVFMRNSQRLILTRLRDKALTVCVLKIQAFQRGNNARKFFVKVKAFQEKVKKVISERNMDTLKATLQEAGEQGIDIFILVRCSDLLTYLEEEKRVAAILEEGCKENELEPINAGLEQVEVMKTKFAGETCSEYYLAIIKQAESQKQALIRKDKARKQVAQAIQNEDITELQSAIKEAAEAGLKPEEYVEAQKLLERLEFEEKCIQDLSKAVEGGDLLEIETKLGPAEGVTLDGKRKEIIANAKETLKKGYFEKLKAKMISAKEDAKNHNPGHEAATPVEQLPLPPEEKAIVEEFIPKLEALKYLDLAAMAKSFLAEQVTQRTLAQKESFFTHLQATVKEAEEDAKNHQPNHEVDTPATELPLPPIELKIKDVILPKLEKLQYEEFAVEAKTVLDRLLNLRVQGLKAAHHDYLQSTLKIAESETKSHLPNHEVDTPAESLPLPPAEKLIKESILPKLTKLGYHEFVETATTFLAAQLSNREVALKEIHHDYLQSIIREADAESSKYMPTEEQEKPTTELPPSEKKIKEQILPKLEKLKYVDFVQTATAFLEAQQAKREAESVRIIQEKDDKIRVAKEAEERKKREEERKKREEEERARLEDERRKEEERLAKEGKKISDLEKQRRDEENKKLQEKIEKERREEEERAKAEALAHEKELQKARDEAERKRVEAEAKLIEQRKKQEAAYLSEKAGNESNQIVMAQKLDEQRKRQEEEYQKEKEAQEKRSAELAEAERAVTAKASEAAKARARHYHPAPAGPPGPGGHPPPPPDDDFNMPPPPPPEEMELPPPPPPEDDGSEKREEELQQAIKSRSLSIISTLLSAAEAHGDKTRTVRIARNLKDVLTEERKILNQLKQCLKDLNVNPLKSLLREAANLGLDNPIISEARHLCYGMSKAELLTKRLTLALKNKEPEKLSALLDEAKEDGIENEEVEHARDFVAMTLDLGDWNSKMRVNRTKSVSGITSSQTAAYKNFLETKGSFPLRRFTNLRKEGNYAKRKYFAKKGLKKKRLIWQKDDIPRSLVKLSTAHCGGVKKSKLVKKIARQIFKNIRGYMGDHYHAYPVTLAYEVVNTGVNEELLRDEIFCQLIKQTTKNPSLDSRLLGWKLLYLCVSTFWPSAELKPILISHLAAHAPPKIHQKEFGFNVISDLAYHCYIALDDKSPPAGEPPSMQDIEKITNGTLGAVKSFFSVEAGDETDEKGEPITETVEEGTEGGEPTSTTTGPDHTPPSTDIFKGATPPPPPPRPSKPSVAATEPHPPPLEDGPPPVDAELPADLTSTYGSKKFHRPGES